MKRIALLFFVAVATLVVLLFFTNPGLLDKLWLWVIGFIGYLIALINTGIEKLSGLFNKEGDQHPPPTLKTNAVTAKVTETTPLQAEVAFLKKKIQDLENQLEDMRKHQPQ